MRGMQKIFGLGLVAILLVMAIGLPVGNLQNVSRQAARQGAGSSIHNAQPDQSAPEDTFVSEPVTPVISRAFSDLTLATDEDPSLNREVNPRLSFGEVVDYNPDLPPDPMLAVQEAVTPATPDAFGTPMLNFNGQGFSGVNPPDTVGEVGTSHYVQMINGNSGTRVTFYNKTTGAVTNGPFILDNLATSGACTSGNGDPVVLYDEAADRWLLSEFAANGNHLCVYISTTSNPTGSYYIYDFTTPNFPDYPKYAVWRDAYYVSTNEGTGSAITPAVYALDRARMLSGQSATFQRRTGPALPGFAFQAFTPADIDGATLPPSGTPGLFMRQRDTELHGPSGQPGNDLVELWGFSVNWSSPGSSSFSKIADIMVAEFDSALCGVSSYECIQQPGTSVRLDPLRELVMWRLNYRNFNTRQVLLGTFSTDVGGDRAGVRWFEMRNTGSGWGLYQEGLYSPGNLSRWMGSVAMDKSGNIALGYNVGNSSTYPGLRYVGRLVSDPNGTTPQGEYTIVNGSGSNASNRYGDYAAMNVDPTDGCTFWFTGQWNAGSTWSTRIAKFKFDQCGSTPPPPTGTPQAYLPIVARSSVQSTGFVTGVVRRASDNQPISGAQVCVLSTNQCATTNAQGAYTIGNVPAGNQTVRASASGYTSLQQAVTVPNNGSATANFQLSSSSVPRTITHSQSQSIMSNNSIACINQQGFHSDNAYLREFRLNDFGITGPFNVSQVQFGVELAEAGSGSAQPVRLRLYRKLNPGAALTYGNLAVITTVNINLSNQQQTIVAVPIAGTAPAGSTLVVEVFTPNGQSAGHSFFIGSNNAGQTAPSYLAAPGCGVSEPTPTANLGEPGMHIVINVAGTTSAMAMETNLVVLSDPLETLTPPASPDGINRFSLRNAQ